MRDTPTMTGAIHDVVSDAGRREALRDYIAEILVHNDEVLGRWAAVMLNANLYAEVVDRHVELAGDLAWLNSLLEQSHPADDGGLRRRRARNDPPS